MYEKSEMEDDMGREFGQPCALERSLNLSTAISVSTFNHNK